MAVSVLLTNPHPPSLSASARNKDHGAAATLCNCSVDLCSHVLVEACESDSAESPNEPATPVSDRNSQELAIEHDESLQHIATHTSSTSISKTLAATTARRQSQATLADTTWLQTPADLPPKPRQNSTTSLQLKRRLTNMTSNIFHPKRPGQADKPQERLSQESVPSFGDVSYDAETSTVTTAGTPRKRFSFHHKSNAATRENSPPSPGSPMEADGGAPMATVPSRDDFGKKKVRSSTGLSLRGRVINFAHGTHRPVPHGAHRPVPRRRASSFSSTHNRPVSKKGESGLYPVERNDDILGPVEVGGGAKARRLSISLPDDFQVDVVDLLSEFEWEHRFRGRHGRIGRGATSKITTVHRKGFPNEVFIVKEFRGKASKEKQDEYEKKIKSEFSIAKSLHHPNIVESIRLCTDHGRWNHVMEYCTGGDMFTLVSKNYLNKPEREKDRACLFKQLIQGIAYLHANGIAHRDIKLENILLTHDSKLKITDFGVSEVFCGLHPGLREAGGQCGTGMGEVRLCDPGVCGSGPYMAPEVIHKDHQYDPRGLDIWSSAIVMCHLTFGGALWHLAASRHAMYAEFVKAWGKWETKHDPGELISEKSTSLPSFLPFDKAFPSFSLKRLIFRMLHPDPKKRITAAEILQSRWMKNTDCCQPESYDEPTKFIDCTKKESLKQGPKIMCHNHLPPVSHGSHSLGKMPGQPGY